MSGASTELDMCRPVLETRGDGAFLHCVGLRNPLLTMGTTDYVVPNDVRIGRDPIAVPGSPGAGACGIIVLTGPNMGGKSTVLRQACLAVILAQVGCYVPATACRLQCFDRIFTRCGASDNIAAGQSTFMVELEETSNILQYATRDSLVVLDELGRGTSTWDGYAIAYAVLQYFALHCPAAVLFSTHYHSLVDELRDNPSVALYHMVCVVEDEISFLYNMAPGMSANSYGPDVALKSGMDPRIVEKARAVSAFKKKEHARAGLVKLLELVLRVRHGEHLAAVATYLPSLTRNTSMTL